MPKFSKEEELLRAIFGDPSGTIGDNLPCGYYDGRMGDRNPELDTMLDVPITGMSDTSCDDDPETAVTYPEPWDGPERFVTRWWTLENGKKVAWLRAPKDSDYGDDFIVR